MYKNSFTRANPGLIVILVDQSGSMDESWSNGRTLAENASNSVNSVVNEIVLKLTLPNGNVKKSIFLTIIGYGQDDDNANVIVDDWINDVDENFPVENIPVATREGLINQDCIKVIDCITGCLTPMASAFKIAKDIVEAWMQLHNTVDDPTPVIVNISDGVPTDGADAVIGHAKEIKALSIPDGNPQIFNIHLSPSGGTEVQFPKDSSSLPDSFAKFLFEISSEVSSDLINEIPSLIGKKISGGERLFMSNVHNPADLTAFLKIGTKVTNMR